MAWYNNSHQRHTARPARRGVTLIELLVAVALTLIVILAIVRVFDLLGGNVNQSRAILELSAQLRTAASQLQNDLDRLTLKPVPPADPLTAPGYFEIVEGKRSDRDTDGDDLMDTDPADTVADTLLSKSPVLEISTSDPANVMKQGLADELRGVMGDVDDVWMGTMRSSGEPFRGRFNGGIIESPLAEVAWWVQPIVGPAGPAAGATELAVVRRVLLILPTPEVRTLLQTLPLSSPAQLVQFLAENDLSVRPEFVDNGGGSLVPRIVPNTLADLAIRRNRFAHWRDDFMSNPLPPLTFPDALNRRFMVQASDLSDLILNDILALDVRVFDPLAPVYRPTPTSSYVLTPVDPGYRLVAKAINAQNQNTFPESYGAYVDLGYNVNAAGQPIVPLVSLFSGPPQSRSRCWLPTAANGPRVYCTWSTQYERDGIDQGGAAGADEGTDGIDTLVTPPVEYSGTPFDPRFVVDDVFERETSPPYPQPLQGVEIVLRVRELSTQQVRQASVVEDFVGP